jgi:hypothetical protein
VNAQALSVAGSVTAASVTASGAVTAASVSATTLSGNIAAARIVTISSGAGGAASYNSAIVAGMTANARVFAQQVSSGAVVVPVVADVYEPGGAGTGFVVRLTADANMPANANFWVFIASL